MSASGGAARLWRGCAWTLLLARQQGVRGYDYTWAPPPPSLPSPPSPPPLHQTVAGYALMQTIYGTELADEAGKSVALSADGQTLAVAARLNDGNDHPTQSNRGHVRVYRHNGTHWDRLGGEHDILGASVSTQLGYSVSLSADGNVVVAGAEKQQRLRVMRWTGTAWEGMGPNDGAISVDSSGFGQRVAISDDGHTVLASAYSAGRLYFFRYQPGTNEWTQPHPFIQEKFPDPLTNFFTSWNSASASLFGYSIALSGDGKTAVAGNRGGVTVHLIRVYRLVSEDDDEWTVIGASLCDATSPSLCTTSYHKWLSLSHDGNTLAIGEWAAEPGGLKRSGRVGVLDYHGAGDTPSFGDWRLRGGEIITGTMMVDEATAENVYAGVVALSADGNTVAVGGHGAHAWQGVVQVFAWSGATWDRLTTSYDDGNRGDGATDTLGYSVALSADGLTLAAGAPEGDGDRGYARVYRAYYHASPPLLPPPPAPPPALPSPPPINALCIEGIWPLFETLAEASAASPTGEGHSHEKFGTIYWMPDGFPGMQHVPNPTNGCPVGAYRLPPPSPPPLPPHAPQDTGIGDDLLPHGGFEIWYSDVSAFFGTKARTVLTGQQARTSVYAIDPTERGDYARGRYVTLRIYHPHKRLRLETMQVFGDNGTPAVARQLFEAPEPEEREPPPHFAPTPTPTPEPEPTPEPTPSPPSDSEEVWGEDPEAWWNNLEISRRAGELYARRVLPGAQGRSAAASVAVAITLAHPKYSVMAGQDATLYAACTALLERCDVGDYWTSVHNRNDADVDADSPDPNHLPIDDAGWAVLLLSRAIEPAVHAVVEGMLLCLSPALCTNHCDVCNEWVGLGNSTAEDVVREVELRLHASTKNASRSVLDCVGSFECLSEVATEVATTLGDARELPATVRLEKVAQANYALLEGAREEAQQNSSWQVRRPARFALLRDHVAAVQAHEQTPLGEDDEAVKTGRRLGERTPPAPPPLTGLQERMKAATNNTCYQLAIKNLTGAHDAHIQATQFWMYMSGGGNDARGQGRVCVDCQFPNFTTSCRGHFAHVGRALTKMRIQAEKPPDDNHAARKRRMTEHARRHLDQICCAIKDGKEVCEARYCAIHVRNNVKRRATHVARQMSEQEHPSAVEHFGVATQLGIDIINPSLHPDPECRTGNRTTDAEKYECMGRSILHHLGKRHGLDYESTKAKLDGLGISIGEGLASAAKMTGMMRDGRGPVKSAFFERQGHDNAAADRLMRESKRRTEASRASGGGGEGRQLLEESESFGGHGLGQHALHAGSMRRQLQNASGIFHSAMMGIDRAATAANNAQSRGSRRTFRSRADAPRQEELEWHTFTHSVNSPLTTLLTVSTEEGSYASRFGGAVVQLNALRDRAANALTKGRRRLEAHDAGLRRRLSPNAAHAEALYQALERSHTASPPAVPALELPESHALSWVHELVDWDRTLEEGSRLYQVLRDRHKLRETGATHADIVAAHPTGWQHLDDAVRSRPSIVGDAVRRVLYRKETGADPPWHESAVLTRVHRRMSERVDGGEGSGSHLRRLAVAFFESTIAAPFAFYDTLMPSGVTAKASEITFWEATLRYVVSSTVGCYFVAPVREESATQGEEGAQGGDKLFVMRPSEEKLCFPAIPFALPQFPTFRDLTMTQGVDQYALNYHDYCSGEGSAMQVTADSLEALGIDPRSENPLLPNAAILRSAEAVDAILNAASSGSSDVPNRYNAGRILCSICQLGGLIYFTLLGIIVLVLINFLPLVNFIFQLLFDGCVACVDIVSQKKLPSKLRKPASLFKAPSARTKGSATGSSAGAAEGAVSVDSVNLTAQQLRSIKRTRRVPNVGATGGATFGQRIRQIGRRIACPGEPPPSASTEGLSLLPPERESVSPSSAQAVWV